MDFDAAIATLTAANDQRLRRLFPIEAAHLDQQFYVLSTPNDIHPEAATLYDRSRAVQPETFPSMADALEGQRARVYLGLITLENASASG